ncbi:MAG: uracil-DNA glycosylase [Dehalococcoidia bacterium]|nr:uracil-DNA glycosylase [Dehalococcoidia bacterium]
MSSKAEQAETLYERIRGCTGCALWKTRTHAVPGEGPLDAELMFIGEGPGMNEDRQGRPFVGQAGNFLEELLAEAGYRRDEVYICNVLKCRPPNNRDPMPDEIEACRAFLDEQIALVDPAVVVSLGRYSMSRFFPKAKVSRVHGQCRDIGDRLFVPMYHPAAALHQAALRQTIIEDFRLLPGYVEHARELRRQRAAIADAEPAPTEAGSEAEQIRLFD